MAIASNKNIFDYVVYGQTTAAHILALNLSRLNHRVLWLNPAFDPSEDGLNEGDVYTELTFVPDEAVTEKLIAQLAQNLQLHIDGDINSMAPQTFQQGHFTPFMGFGERKFKTIDAMSFYMKAPYRVLTTGPSEWNRAARNLYLQDLEWGAVITYVLPLEEGGFEITVNGAQKVRSTQLIWADDPQELVNVRLSESKIPQKLSQKFSKNQGFTAIELYLAHSQSLNFESDQQLPIQFLMGSKDDFEPCIGRFFLRDFLRGGESSLSLTSTWMTLLPADVEEDTEFLGNMLRFMKRQIKRAFPEAAGNISSEKIIIRSKSHGAIDLGHDYLGPDVLKIPGLYLCQHQLTPFPGWLGELHSAFKLLESLGFTASPEKEKPPSNEAPSPDLL